VSASWEEIGDVFDEAAALSGAERARFLDERCGARADLRREVESLLEQDDTAGDYLTPPHAALTPIAAAPVQGAVIGEFRILHRLGTGGMGTVYVAEQVQPQRRVALKILPPLSDDPSARRRFAQEAELLARMNHPSIAQVFAAGVDGDTPFLAMELVEGALPVTEYVRRHELGWAASIALFRHVCAAVAHGHSKGVVHRDLKPGNVLVDAHGAPKVIDFGIARALDAVEGEGARMTRTGDLVGTLQYMSPEQAEGRVAEVDAQSDVHALGLILYEILCGRRAYSLEGKALTVALRTISEHSVPRARAARPGLPQEVDWILSKALEKDRARRYASVAELDADLERFLAHEPVLAGPPSRLYEARKFVRRHRIAVAALAAVFAALTIGLVVSLRERARAEKALVETATRTRQLEIETGRKDRILDFQRRLLTSASPDAEGYDVRVVDLLDLARSDLRLTPEEPEVALELHAALGEGYASLGRMEDALAERSAALGIARSVPDLDPVQTAGLERVVLRTRGELHTDPALVAEMRALVTRNAQQFGPSAPETARSHLALAQGLRLSGSLDEAEEHARTALASSGAEAKVADWALGELAAVLVERGNFQEAEEMARALLEQHRLRLGAEHTLTLFAQSKLVNVIRLTGASEEAEREARTIAEIHARRSGPDHVATLAAQIMLCSALIHIGRREEAIGIALNVSERARPQLQQGLHGLSLATNLAELMRECGRNEEAIALLERAQSQCIAAGIEDTPPALRASTALGAALAESLRFAEAEPIVRAALEAGEARLGPENRNVVAARHSLATVLMRTKRPALARDLLTTNLAIQRRVLGSQHDDTLSTLQSLAEALVATGALGEGESAIREALAARYARFGAEHPRTRHARYVLARLLYAAGRFVEAEMEMCELTSVSDPDPSKVSYLNFLAGTRLALERHLDALDAFRDAHATAARVLPPDSPAALDTALNLASQWRRLDQPDSVPPLLEPLQDACLASGGTEGARAKACRSMLLKSYDELGRTEDAARLREQIAAESP